MRQQELISIVVPVFNEAEGIEEFYTRAKAVAESMIEMEHELIFVDDGSRDGSFRKLNAIAQSDSRVIILKFARNFGHQIAITAGLDAARGDCVVVIDSDLQDPPEVIPRMVDKWRAGYDVVFGVRSQRDGESAMKLLTASLFYRLLRKVTNIEIPVDVGDFRLMSRRALDHLKSMRENDRFVRGLVSWIGFNQIGLEYERAARFAGETKYPYRKMLKFALDGITSFSTAPLKLASLMGYLASGLAFFGLISMFPLKWLGYTISGWASMMVGMFFLGGVQLVCLGIIGEYIGRIFMEVKKRPLYIVEQEVRSMSRREAEAPALARV
ncbi:MAG TPA: glycosyltransferase family 2 protein [Longimicrobiales bacterium]